MARRLRFSLQVDAASWYEATWQHIGALLAVVLLVASESRTSAAESELVAIARQGVGTVIVSSTNSPLVEKTARWYGQFLTRQGFRSRIESSLAAAGSNSTVWILETESHCPIAKSMGADLAPLAAARADAFYLSVSDTNGLPRVVVVGKDEVGLRSGVARLVGEAMAGDDRLLAPRGSVVRSPFFPIRELVVANRGVVLKNTPYADTLWRQWDDERIRTYVEQLWLCGFNSLQFCEGRSFRITPESEASALGTARKYWLLSDAAHENGLKVSQLLWGQAPFNRKICWSSPETRATMEAEFRWLARFYAAKVDHVVMHMRDPGGCNCGKCDDYKTPQEIAAFVLAEYRKVNPAVTVTLSTWFNQTFWDYAPGVKFLGNTSVQYWTGQPDAVFRDQTVVKVVPGAPGTKFLDETFCPPDVGIALHKWYNAEKASAVLDRGRAVDVWSWYLSDQETTTDMSLCTRRLDYYFSSLPRGASNDVRRFSTELCFHGWPQVINAWVSGQKMWSPRRPLAEIEMEFCSGMFGETNAAAVKELYDACELVANPKRGDTCLPSLDTVFGNPIYNQRFRIALAAGEKIVLDKSRPPRLTTATPPQALLDYLLRHLKLILTLSEAQERLTSARQTGVAEADLKQLLKQARNQSGALSNELLYPVLMDHLSASLHSPSK